MTTTIEISGIPIERLKGSLQISKSIECRNTATFTVVDWLGTASYVRGQLVEITTDANVQFGGYINKNRKRRISPKSATIYHSLECMDYHYLAAKRIAAESYVSQTAGFIVDDLYDKYLAPEGVSIGTIQAGPTIEEMVINYQPVSLALDVLAEKSGFIWYIDESKALYFVARDTTLAPFSIDASIIIKENNMDSELTESNDKYRNRQYIRAGRDITILQTENRTGDGETKAFAMGYPLNQVPSITVDAFVQIVGIKGIDTVKDCYWSKGDAIITFETAPPLGDAIVVEYYGEFDIMILAEDTPEIAARKIIEGGTGVVEALDDEPTLNSKQAAFDSALASLAKYGIIGKQFVFPIRTYGILPGQMATVDYPEYGLNSAELLIEAVDIDEVAPGELRYIIKAIEGPELGDWTGFFKALASMREQVLGRLNIGKDQILIILVSVPENWIWDEVVTEIVNVCPLPALDLYPGLTLYPC